MANPELTQAIATLTARITAMEAELKDLRDTAERLRSGFMRHLNGEGITTIKRIPGLVGEAA